MLAQLTCAVAAALLCLWGLQRLWTLAAALSAKPRATDPRSAGDGNQRRIAPVTVQVPLFNEPHVALRAVEAACALRWPDLEIQILDDSTDDTPHIVAAAVARARSRGVDVAHIRRDHRAGFKAGALAHGLALARGELVAIFDADFVAPPDFLERMVPVLEDSGADMAQARWGHLNRDASWLTRAQAALLDAHFAVEQLGRSSASRFFGFNGTAGVWRKSAIERAGGWDARTLTEDLDLSLRAWFSGSKFVYVDDVVVPAELPANLGALRIQQHRWAKGAMQTARVRLPDVLRAKRPWTEKLDVTLKLTQNFSFVLLSLFVLALPLAALETAGATSAFPGIELAALAFGSLPAFASVLWALSRCGRKPLATVVDAVLALGLAAALSAHAALAALAGTLDLGSRTFERTPKDGAARERRRSRMKPLVFIEAALGVLHLVVVVDLCSLGLLWRTPFLLLCGTALLWLVARSVVEALPRVALAAAPLTHFSTASALSADHSQKEPS